MRQAYTYYSMLYEILYIEKPAIIGSFCFIQDAICRSVTQLSQRHLAAAFSGWREHASEAAALRQQLQRVVQRLAMLRAGAAFMAWQQSAQQGTALKTCLRKAVQYVAPPAFPFSTATVTSCLPLARRL